MRRFLFILIIGCAGVAALQGTRPADAQPALCAFDIDASSAQITHTARSGSSIGLALAPDTQYLKTIGVRLKQVACPGGKTFAVSIDDNAPAAPGNVGSSITADIVNSSPFHILTVSVSNGTSDIGTHRYYVYALPHFNDVLVTSSGAVDTFTWSDTTDRTVQIILHHPAGQRETADYTLTAGADSASQLVFTASGYASAALRSTGLRLFGGSLLKGFSVSTPECSYIASSSAPTPVDAALGSTKISLMRLQTDCSGYGAVTHLQLAALSRLGARVAGTVSWVDGAPLIRFKAKAVSLGSSLQIANVQGAFAGSTLALTGDVSIPGWHAGALSVPFSITNNTFAVAPPVGSTFAVSVHGVNVAFDSLSCSTSGKVECTGAATIDGSNIAPQFPKLTAAFQNGRLVNVTAPSTKITLAQLMFDVGQWTADFTNGVHVATTGTIQIVGVPQPLQVTQFGLSADPNGGSATVTASITYLAPAGTPLSILDVLSLNQLNGKLTVANNDAVLDLSGSGKIALGQANSPTYVTADVNNVGFKIRGGTASQLDLSGLKSDDLSNFNGSIAGHEIDFQNCTASAASARGANDPNVIEICARVHLLPATSTNVVSAANDALDTRIRFRRDNRAFAGASIHYPASPATDTRELRLGSLSFTIVTADLVIRGGDPVDEDFGTGHHCKASMLGQAALAADAPATSGTPASVKIRPEIAIGNNCYVFVSEGLVAIPLSLNAGASITHIEISHMMNKDYVTQPEDHLLMAGMLHSGNISAVVQKAGFDRGPFGNKGAQQFTMVFWIDKKTTLALNAVNNAEGLLHDLSAGFGALFGFAVKH